MNFRTSAFAVVLTARSAIAMAATIGSERAIMTGPCGAALRRGAGGR
jgi:hypothetical protein